MKPKKVSLRTTLQNRCAECTASTNKVRTNCLLITQIKPPKQRAFKLEGENQKERTRKGIRENQMSRIDGRLILNWNLAKKVRRTGKGPKFSKRSTQFLANLIKRVPSTGETFSLKATNFFS